MKQASQLRLQRQHARCVLPTLAALAAILVAGSSLAAGKYWDTSASANLQGGNGTWDTGSTALWNTNTTAAGLTTWADGDDARFQVADAAASTVTISGTVQANSLTMGNGRTVVINGGTLQLGPGGVTNLGSAAVLTVNSPVQLAGNQMWTNNTGNSTLTFNGSIGESVPGSVLTIGGVGSFYLTASNAYTGGTFLPKGALYISNNCALGSGPLTLAGSALYNLTNLTSTSYNGWMVTWLTNNITVAAGTTSTVGISASPLDEDFLLSGAISGSGTLIHSGGGWVSGHGEALILLGNNSGFSGMISNSATIRLYTNETGSANARWAMTAAGQLYSKGAGAVFRLGTLEGPAGATMNNDAGTNTLEIGGANLDCMYNGVIRNLNYQNPLSLTKVGTGVYSMLGSNNANCSTGNYYSGSTLIRGGTIRVAWMTPLLYGGNTRAMPLGGGRLILDGGTLQYVGPGEAYDWQVMVGTNGGCLETSGTGAMLYTNRLAMLFTNSGPRTLTLLGSSTASNVLAAGIGDNGGATSLAKGGGGLWLLTGTNRCTGTLSVTGGTLWAEGSFSNSAVTIAGGSLGGTGTIAGAVTANAAGHLAPGHATGSIKIGGLTLNTGASYDVAIAGTNFTLNGVEQYSRAKIAATGAVALSGGALNVNLGSYSLGLRDKFGIIQNTASSAISGTFLNLPEGSTVLRTNGCSLNITYTGNVTDTTVSGAGTGNDVVLYASPTGGSAILVR